MGRRLTLKVARAVEMVAAGQTPREAIAATGAGASVVYAALKRRGIALDRSEASKRAWADPEVRAKMSEARKRAWADPEVRAKMSEARKRAWARRCVVLAKLPLRKSVVDRARALLDRGDIVEVVVDALALEFAANGARR